MTTRTLPYADTLRREAHLPDAWGALVIVVLSLALWAAIGAVIIEAASLAGWL